MIADQLHRQGFSHPVGGPEPAFGICGKVTRGVIRGWMSRKQGKRQAKGFPKRS